MVKWRTIFLTRSVFPSINRDRLSHFPNSYVIYKFKCRYDAVYIGRTNQKLQIHITQNIPTYLRLSQNRLRNTQSVHDSSIGQHLLNNPDCAAEYDRFFFLLYRDRSVYHLRLLKAVCIKVYQPSLYKQFIFIRSNSGQIMNLQRL